MTPEVAAFIRAQPREWGYARLAIACRAAFGAEAPDAEAIRAWWLAHGDRPDGRRFLADEPEVAEAIRDMAGRVPIADIQAALAARFPDRRLPSRTALYRHVERLLRSPATPRRDRA